MKEVFLTSLSAQSFTALPRGGQLVSFLKSTPNLELPVGPFLYPDVLPVPSVLHCSRTQGESGNLPPTPAL